MVSKKSKKVMVGKIKKGFKKISKKGKGKQNTNQQVYQKKQPNQLQIPKASSKPDVVYDDDEEESDHGEGLLGMVEEDDLAFLKTAVTNKSYSMLRNIGFKTNDEGRRGKKRSEDDNATLEEAYHDQANAMATKRSKLALPIKTKHGLVRRMVEEEAKLEDTTPEQNGDDEAGDGNSDDELVLFEENDNGLDFTEPVSTAQLLAVREETLQKRKFLIGVLSSGILEAPETKEKNFVRLLDMLDEPNSEIAITVRKWAAVSLLEVFKDLLPGYQIKPIEDTGVKLKKATLLLQNFEVSLLKHYKSYLQKMETMALVLQKKRGDARIRSPQELKLAELAVKCMCELLVMHPYFNFSTNLAQLLVLFLDNRNASVRKLCLDSFRKVFKDDKKGELTLHIVRRINYMVKTKSNAVHCEVLSVLTSLRIKDVNLDKEKEIEMKQKKFMNHKQKLLNMSKNERKRSKKLEELDKEMMETKAEENKQSKQQNLTEITKTVFTIYFRILKKDPSSKLLAATLEGLAKFSACINLDFYHDLVNVMDQLLESSTLGCREQLHCVQTVFTILSGQGDVLTIDPLRFYTHLYRNLLEIHAGRNHSNLTIVLRTLELVLIRRRKKISQQRLLAFCKRLSLLAMQVLHNGSLGCLAIVRTIMQLDKSIDILLDSDSTFGQGTYTPELEDPEYCNASNAALWELTALQRHYHPVVRRFANNIVHGVPASGEGSLLPEYGKLSTEELFKEFDPSEVKFNPTVPVWKKNKSHSKHWGELHLHNKVLQDEVNTVMARQENVGDSLDIFSNWSMLNCVKKEEDHDVEVDYNIVINN